MHKYTIVKFIEPVADGTEFNMTEWPLHITLADDFELGISHSDFIEQLKKLALKQEPVKVVAESDGYLGKYSQVQVTFIDTNPDLFELHRGLVTELKRIGAVFYNPHYIIGGYRPHITVQRAARARRGDVVIINKLSIVDMSPDGDDNQRKVIETIEFAKSFV